MICLTPGEKKWEKQPKCLWNWICRFCKIYVWTLTLFPRISNSFLVSKSWQLLCSSCTLLEKCSQTKWMLTNSFSRVKVIKIKETIKAPDCGKFVLRFFTQSAPFHRPTMHAFKPCSGKLDRWITLYLCLSSSGISNSSIKCRNFLPWATLVVMLISISTVFSMLSNSLWQRSEFEPQTFHLLARMS